MELKQYFKVIQKKWWLIISIMLVTVIATGVKAFFYTTPIYYANAKIIVNQSNSNDGQNSVNMSALQTSIFLINSYKEIIKSEAIIAKVVERYPDLGASAGAISSRISVTSASNSQVMDLSYQDASYERAANIVNAVAVVFKEEIPHIMNADNITILTQADPTAPANPINGSPLIYIFISLIVSALLSIGLVFLLDYLDDTLKTEGDVSEIIELPVLAVVGKIGKSDLKVSRKTSISQNAQVGDKQYATINQ